MSSLSFPHLHDQLLNPKFHLMDRLKDHTVAPPRISGQTRTGLVVHTFLSAPLTDVNSIYCDIAISCKVTKREIIKDGDLRGK